MRPSDPPVVNWWESGVRAGQGEAGADSGVAPDGDEGPRFL